MSEFEIRIRDEKGREYVLGPPNDCPHEATETVTVSGVTPGIVGTDQMERCLACSFLVHRTAPSSPPLARRGPRGGDWLDEALEDHLTQSVQAMKDAGLG